MDLKEKRVYHTIQGSGKVVDFSKKSVVVWFDGKSIPTPFIFPDDFKKGNMSFADATIQKEVEMLPSIKLVEEKKTTGIPITSSIISIQDPIIRNRPDRVLKDDIHDDIFSYSGNVTPSSAVMTACILGGGKRYSVMIVANNKQQSTKEGIYWHSRTLAKGIISAHFNGENTFTYKNVTYTIEEVRKHFQYTAEKARWEKFNNSETKELFVFKQKGIYDNQENGYELVDASLYFPKNGEAVKVAVYYQESLSRFFMNEESFVPLVRDFGMPKVKLHFTSDANIIEGFTGTFNVESKLKLLGYSVQKVDGMSSAVRQRLLYSIITNGNMTDAEVANYLEMFIHLNSGKPNMVDACSAWREDLEYIHKNFSDLRRKTDFYETADIGSRPTSYAKYSVTSLDTHSTPMSSADRKPDTNPVPVRPSRNAATTSSTYNNQIALKTKRDQLLAELRSSTGLFNFFKRRRINREIKAIEQKLN